MPSGEAERTAQVAPSVVSALPADAASVFGAGLASGRAAHRRSILPLERGIEALRAALAPHRPLDRVALARGTGELERLLEAASAELEKNEARLEAAGLRDRSNTLRATRLHSEAEGRELLARLRDPSADPALLRGELDRVLRKGPTHGSRIVRHRGAVGTPQTADSFPALSDPDEDEAELEHAGQGTDRPPLTGAVPPLDASTAVLSAAYQPSLTPSGPATCAPGSVSALCAPALEGTFSPTVVARAAALGNDPYGIYEYVRNEIALEPYLGLNKGADAVMQTGVGGPQDQMALLGTLLRAAGFPVQYAFGWVYVPMGQLESWLGQDNPTATEQLVAKTMSGQPRLDAQGALLGYYLYLSWAEAFVPYGSWYGDAPGPVTPGTLVTGTCAPYGASDTDYASRNYATCTLTVPAGGTLDVGGCDAVGGSTDGSDTYLLLFDSSGNQVTGDDDSCGSLASRVRHVSATTETYTLHEGCYAGATCSGTMGYRISTESSGTGRRWVPLMPYFKPNRIRAGHPEAVAAIPFDEGDFLSQIRPELADEYVQRRLATGLAVTEAGYSVGEVAQRATLIPERIGMLPTTLPVEVVNAETISRAPGMPDNYVLKATVNISRQSYYGYGGYGGYGGYNYPVVSALIDVPTSGLNRLVLTWEAGSSYDQQLIDLYGGLANTPPGSVNLAPVIWLDGRELQRGDTMTYGYEDFNIQMYFEQFGSRFTVRDKWRPVGTIYNVGFDGFQYSQDSLTQCEAELVETASGYAYSQLQLPQGTAEALTGNLLHCAGMKYLLDEDRSLRETSAFYGFQRIRDPQHLTTESKVDVYYLFDRPYLVIPGGAVLDAWGLSGQLVSLDGDDAHFLEADRVHAYASSALEHQLWEHFLVEQSISTTKLLQRAHEIGMPVFDFPAYTDEGTIRASLQLSAHTVDSIVDAVNQGARVVAHQSPQTINDWTGEGWYIQASDFFGMLISVGSPPRARRSTRARPQGCRPWIIRRRTSRSDSPRPNVRTVAPRPRTLRPGSIRPRPSRLRGTTTTTSGIR